MKFRKIPHVVDAEQWFPGRAVDGVVSEMTMVSNGVFIMNSFGSIKTLEGVMTVSPGDFIVRGIKGELWPVKPDVFALTYEAVDKPVQTDILDVTPVKSSTSDTV